MDEGWLSGLAFFALVLVTFTAWALHRARRWVDRNRAEQPHYWENLPP